MLLLYGIPCNLDGEITKNYRHCNNFPFPLTTSRRRWADEPVFHHFPQHPRRAERKKGGEGNLRLLRLFIRPVLCRKWSHLRMASLFLTEAFAPVECIRIKMGRRCVLNRCLPDGTKVFR